MDALVSLKKNLDSAIRALEERESYKNEIVKLKREIEVYKTKLTHFQDPKELNEEDLKSYVAIQKENENLRRTHLELRKEKGEQKHKADMLEQRVMRLEQENAKLKRTYVSY